MSDEPPIPLDPNFRIQLPNFEGPLDLLLYLIQKHELDIVDLPIAFVTEKYVQYISTMQRLNLDVAGEYLVMAATLAHIKSKTLLPEPPKDPDDPTEEELDPRAELIRRLLEYQKFKNAAEQLGGRGIAGRDVFGRGVHAEEASGPPPLAPVSVFKLIDAFQLIAKRLEKQISLEVTAERITINERIEEILDELAQRKRMSFERLFEGVASTYDLVVTFLALLEMAKSRLVRIYQADPDSPIYLEQRVTTVDPSSLEGGHDAVFSMLPALEEADFAGQNAESELQGGSGASDADAPSDGEGEDFDVEEWLRGQDDE